MVRKCCRQSINSSQSYEDVLNQNKYEFPQWIFPIVDNQKKLYIEGEELANAEDTEDIINVRLSNEIDDIINIFDEVTKYSSYRNQMKSLKNYNYQNSSKNTNLMKIIL